MITPRISQKVLIQIHQHFVMCPLYLVYTVRMPFRPATLARSSQSFFVFVFLKCRFVKHLCFSGTRGDMVNLGKTVIQCFNLFKGEEEKMHELQCGLLARLHWAQNSVINECQRCSMSTCLATLRLKRGLSKSFWLAPVSKQISAPLTNKTSPKSMLHYFYYNYRTH